MGGGATIGRIIETEADLAEGAAWLAARDRHLAGALALTGLPPLRRRADGFAGLLSAIVGQQLSVAAADTIWRRLEAAGATSPAGLLALPDATLRGCGLSAAKLRAARALALAPIDHAALRLLPDEALIARLTALPGIGVWTAEIHALFALGRADVFPAGDLALREAARLLFGLPARPAPARLRAMAAAWSPWRAVAARVMWAYYRAAKQREGVRA
ncbi:MAG: DNA-3-methyladenine glycosylase 2 family protein [Alphaproteobacteria bacterium]|nr:MAG: DNA-3-methyladenine glycosylase 2 family protein [Alphaproteobacteria bacterium]